MAWKMGCLGVVCASLSCGGGAEVEDPEVEDPDGRPFAGAVDVCGRLGASDADFLDFAGLTSSGNIVLGGRYYGAPDYGLGPLPENSSSGDSGSPYRATLGSGGELTAVDTLPFRSWAVEELLRRAGGVVLADDATLMAGEFFQKTIMWGDQSLAAADGWLVIARMEVDGTPAWALQLDVRSNGSKVSGPLSQMIAGDAGDAWLIGHFGNSIQVVGGASFEAEQGNIFAALHVTADGSVDELVELVGTFEAMVSVAAALGQDGTLFLASSARPGEIIDFGDGPVEPGAWITRWKNGQFGETIRFRAMGGESDDYHYIVMKALSVAEDGRIAFIAVSNADIVDFGGGPLPIEHPRRGEMTVGLLNPDGALKFADRYQARTPLGAGAIRFLDRDLLVGGGTTDAIRLEGIPITFAEEVSGQGLPFLMRLGEDGEVRWMHVFAGGSVTVLEPLADGSVLLAGEFLGRMAIGDCERLSAGHFDTYYLVLTPPLTID